jgi:hypothetical protein
MEPPTPPPPDLPTSPSPSPLAVVDSPGSVWRPLGRLGRLALAVAIAAVVPLAGEAAVGAATAPRSAPLRVLGGAGVAATSPGPPLRLADALSPTRSLPPAASGAGDALAAMAAWNAAGEKPRQVGFARPLPRPLRFTSGGPTVLSASTADGAVAKTSAGLVWGALVDVAGGHRLRLRLDAALLPAGTRLWVWGAGEAPRAFGLELREADGTLWTPSVGGPLLALEVELPRGAAAGAELTAGEVLELFPGGLAATGEASTAVVPPACLVDAACVAPADFPALGVARHAIAHLQYVRPGALVTRAFLCTGALLNDGDESTTRPLLLTANHCFDSAGAAASLEAFFDYTPSSCGAPPPALKDLPRSTGARLLATAEATDVTLVELFELPPGRTLLGWTTAPLAAGAQVHRLSHPFHDGEALPQSWSLARVDHNFGICTGFSHGKFLYSRLQRGGTLGGSSGSPVMTADGVVVGQLLGTCGAGPDACAANGAEVDGALVSSFELLAPFLAPAPPTPCVASPWTLCLDGTPGDARYRVEARWATAQAGRLAGTAVAVPLTADGVTRGGVFWFFTPELPELLVKIVDGCASNGHRWLFLGPATNVGAAVVVTDTKTGQVRVYAGDDLRPARPVHDLNAFRCDG